MPADDYNNVVSDNNKSNRLLRKTINTPAIDDFAIVIVGKY